MTVLGLMHAYHSETTIIVFQSKFWPASHSDKMQLSRPLSDLPLQRRPPRKFHRKHCSYQSFDDLFSPAFSSLHVLTESDMRSFHPAVKSRFWTKAGPMRSLQPTSMDILTNSFNSYDAHGCLFGEALLVHHGAQPTDHDDNHARNSDHASHAIVSSAALHVTFAPGAYPYSVNRHAARALLSMLYI